MNPQETVSLTQLIRRIRDEDMTIILIEHDMRVVMGISDRIVVLDHGEKIAEGLPDEVADAYRAADLEVMAADARRMRGERPFVMANLKAGVGVAEVAGFTLPGAATAPVSGLPRAAWSSARRATSTGIRSTRRCSPTSR